VTRRAIPVVLLAGLISLSLPAVAAKDADIGQSGSAPHLNDVLEHFTENPLGYSVAVERYCAVDSHADSDVCSVADDVSSWSGNYDNRKVEIVPPVALPTDRDGYAPLPAMDMLPKLTKDRRVVILNEVHDNPETRLLAYALLGPLREQGFDTVALETISNDDSALGSRGYPVFKSGYYTREPTMARLVREALRLGFHVVGYDSLSAGGNDVALREQAQAEQLAKIVSSGAGHRVFVVAGMAHAYKKAGTYLQGVDPMAARLAAILKTDPLSIDQIYTFDSAWGTSHVPDGLYVFARNSKVWTAQPGQFDVSIVARINRRIPARLAWAPLAPWLHLVKVDARPCAGRPCMVAGYRPGDAASAVPLDQVLLSKHSSDAQLLLPAGETVLRYRDAAGKVIATDPR